MEETLNVTTGESDSYEHLSKVNVIEIVIYSIFFVVGGATNLMVLYNLYMTSLYKTSRHDFLLLNLVIADSMVCFALIPTEIGWRLTGFWLANNIGCKLFQFARVFAIYLSSLILICISIDRYYAVNHPFEYNQADHLIRFCVKTAWALSAISSIPQ
ncbi:gonadotropin-releasing hormone II receptor-like protein, partial [Dinothrombium tinctorium]